MLVWQHLVAIGSPQRQITGTAVSIVVEAPLGRAGIVGAECFEIRIGLGRLTMMAADEQQTDCD